MKIDLKTSTKTVVFQDDDPTHYVDLGVTKDKKFFIISSNTKEDSEILVLKRDEESEKANEPPMLLVPRKQEIRAHIDHVRDFFVTITNSSAQGHSLIVASMADSELEKSDPDERVWEDFLDPKSSKDDLVLTEIDPFKDFIALYCKRNGKPEIMIQDLDSKSYSTINVNDDVGTIGAGMN